MKDVTLTDRIEEAISMARRKLVEEQQEDGSWPGVNCAGPQATAQYLVTMSFLNELSPRDAEEGARWLRHVQLDDGSYAASPGDGPSSVDTTGVVLAGLTAAGVSSSDTAFQRAKKFLDQNGGFAKTTPPTQVFAACVGLVEPDTLPKQNFLLRWIPHGDRFIDRRFSFGVGYMLNAMPPVVLGLQNKGPLPKGGLFRFYEHAGTVRYLSEHQNPQGSWAGLVATTTFGLLALYFLEVRSWDPRMQAGISALKRFRVYTDEGLQCSPYSAEVWNTAGAVGTLLAVRDASSSKAVERGIKFILTQQSLIGVPPNWENPAPGATTSGGWSYGVDNQLTSDCDTTASVLWLLQLASNAGTPLPVKEAIEAGRNWLFNMQNECGGWPAFTHGLRAKPPGPMFKTNPTLPTGLFGMLRALIWPPLELGDPAWEDVTGRVLQSLAVQGISPSSPQMKSGIQFLKDQLVGQTAWWGRWEVNYVTSSSYILSGLKAAGVSPKEAWVSGVAEWIESCQNEDGGWGDDPISYQDPSKKGHGTSRFGITAIVLSALFAMDRKGPVLDAGFAFLLDGQGDDGFWDLTQPVGVLAPPYLFYLNSLNGQCEIIDALAQYAQIAGTPS